MFKHLKDYHRTVYDEVRVRKIVLNGVKTEFSLWLV